MAALWAARTDPAPRNNRAMQVLLTCPEYRVDQILAAERFKLAPAEEFARISQELRQKIYVNLEGYRLFPQWINLKDQPWEYRQAKSVNGRTMVQIRSLAEALALLEPAAQLLRENFSSWDEAYENYLDGYNWWARNNVLGQDVWETDRGRLYREMKADPATAAIFNDSLFQTGVIPVPGLSWRDVK